MNNNWENRVMNFTQPRHTSSESTPPLMHNFMPMSSSSAHVDYDLSESENQASFKNQLKQNMQSFWRERLSEICEAPTDVRSPHSLPLARIKKVMKSDENVKMISGDTPVLLGKACEIFVMELSVRAWMHTQLNNHRMVQRNDIALALSHIIHPSHQEEPHLPIPNHAEVYAPVSVRGVPIMPPNYLPNQWEEVAAAAGGGPAASNDHHELGFGMNFQGNLNHGLFRRGGGMQAINPEFPPPSPSADGTNPYLNFRAKKRRERSWENVWLEETTFKEVQKWMLKCSRGLECAVYKLL